MTHKHRHTQTHTQTHTAPHLSQQQEVVEQEAVQLFAALGFEQFPAVEKLPGTQTVCDRVKHQLLSDRHRERETLIIVGFTQSHISVDKHSRVSPPTGLHTEREPESTPDDPSSPSP